MRKFFEQRLSPFRHQAFRRFFLVQTLSFSGSFATDIAKAWIVLQMTSSAAALGGVLLASALPGLFFSLHGGVLADRVDVRRLMMVTKFILGCSALTLAMVTEFYHIEYWELICFAILEGVVNAFDFPTTQGMIVRIVPRADFQQAIALNSTNFHTSRMLGPLVASLLLAWKGPAAVFLFDAVTFFLLVAVLNTIRPNSMNLGSIEKVSPLNAMIEGLRYLRNSPTLNYKIMQLVLTISLVFPLMIVVFRTYLQKRFQLDAEQFGYIFTFPAVGSMIGALSFAVIQPRQPIRALLFGVPGTAFFMTGVPLMQEPYSAAILMSLSGFFMYLTFAALTVSAQLEVAEKFRGRISSMIGLCFVSIGPLMGFPVGSLADYLGFEMTIFVMVLNFLFFSGCLALLYQRAKKRSHLHSASN